MCVVLKKNNRPGSSSETYEKQGGTVRLSGKVPSAVGTSAARTRVGNSAKRVVAMTRREIRKRSMESFFGVGQFVITVSALIAAIFAVCVCLKTTLAGPSGALILGCLALVVLLPLLGTAMYEAIQDEREGRAVANYVRVADGSLWEIRSALDNQHPSMGVRALACMSCLVFVCAIIACVCLDVKNGTWYGSALLLAAMALFTVAAVAIGTQRYSSVVPNDAEVYRVDVDVLAAPSGDRQPGAAGATLDSRQGDATPGTFVSSVGLGSAVASGAGVSEQQVASHRAREHGASIAIY